MKFKPSNAKSATIKEQTVQLEAETAMMEKRLEMFKNLMRDINPYKAMNEREFAKKVSSVTETVEIKSQQSLPKNQFKIKPGKQNPIVKPKSANALEFLKEFDDQNESVCDGLELIFKSQTDKNTEFFDRVLESAHLGSLKGRLVEAGVNDFDALRNTSIETFNQLFITANKQEKIKAAIEALIPYKKPEEPVTQGTQADFLGPAELPVIHEEPDHPNLIDNSKANARFKKANETHTMTETSLQTEEVTDLKFLTAEENNYQAPNSSWYEPESFTFSSILPISQPLIEEKTKEKLIVKPAVCYHCFSLFLPQNPLSDPTNQVSFCSNECEAKSQTQNPQKQPIGMTDHIIEENVEQAKDTESSDDDLQDVDLDFTFDL